MIETARRQPDDIALRLEDAEVSFANLDAASARLAGLLVARGLRPGDRVAIMLPNVPYFAIVYYGALRAGGVAVPLNVLFDSRETAVHLAASAASFVFVSPAFALAARSGADAAGAAFVLVTPGDFEELLAESDALDEPVARADTETAVIIYAPGSTEAPEGAELTHATLRGNVAVVVDRLGLTASDVILGALPLFYAIGQTAELNAAVAAGSCLTLIPRFTPETALEIIERDGVTVFEGVPAMFAALLRSSARNSGTSLRRCVSGGATLAIDVMREFEEAFGCAVLERDEIR
nr:AMP-binding protein [Antrihabitans stalactiti]